MAEYNAKKLGQYLENFCLDPSNAEEDGKTQIQDVDIQGTKVIKYINEFWTSKQRQALPIHEVSYRACFKPQLPRFFINFLTVEGDTVYDPFSGRGTTVVEAGLLGRKVIANDINPLSEILCYPRFFVPELKEVEERLGEIPIDIEARADIDISMFYHPDTEAEIVSLKDYLLERKQAGMEDPLDKWIRMVATNRLTGHSKGFFSVYTLPPNQATSPERQIKINERRGQTPEYRNTHKLILKKTKSLIKKITERQRENLYNAGKTAVFLTEDARETLKIPSDSVKLTVTSPPFLDIVQYSQDNWLRCWFNSIDVDEVSKKISMTGSVEKWSQIMQKVFDELFRITKKDGWVAFEVGEVRRGSIRLDEYIVPLGLRAGFNCEGILINLQEFTKTSNIWGIDNNISGTNTNRIVLFKKQV